MTITNLTPHAINFQDETGGVTTFSPSGVVVRVNTETTSVDTLLMGKFPLQFKKTLSLGNLPERKEGEIFLVSGMVLDAVQKLGMKGFIAPATGPDDGAIRNEKGHIVAVTKFDSAL